MEDGVWRTIGGRRVFIKKGQSVSSAMKESGKFNKANKTKKEREAEFEKNIEEQYNRFHGKTDKEVAEEIAKERGERLLTDKEQKQREVEFMKNLEKEVDNKKQAKAGSKITSDSYNKQMDAEYKKLKDGKISTEEYLKNTDKISDEYYKERNKLYDDYKKIDKNAKNEGTIDELREKYEKASGTKGSNDDSFTMYNSKYDKEVKVKKGADGKWIDSDGNKYMGYLSKEDVKSYFKGDWKEQKSNANDIINSQLNKTRDAKVEVAEALGLKFEKDNQWKSTSQLYKEQKGKDLVETAINSKDAKKYQDFVSEYRNKELKGEKTSFSDRADIDKYAKENGLDADSLYYMSKIASESDRRKLRKASETDSGNSDWVKKAFQDYKKEHPKTKLTIDDFRKKQK